MKAFRLNGWTVTPCDASDHAVESFDITAPGERYHFHDLWGAVNAAQMRTGEPPEDHLSADLSDKLYDAVEQARNGQGIEGGTDYVLRNLAADVLAALNEARS
jgi:hypothetical protein